MPYDPAQHHRHSIRLRGFDYARHGAYFVTLCAARQACLFGAIQGDGIQLSPWGRMVNECWQEIPRHFPGARLDEYVIMPNHVHGVLWLDNTATQERASAALGTMMGSFKSAATKRINQSGGVAGGIVWQRNFFEHVIRNEESLAAIRYYIQTNPQRWEHDIENPNSDGSDDVEKWVAELTVGATHASPSLPSPNNQGGACPAPTANHGQDGACPAPTANPAKAGHAPPLHRIGHGYDIHRLKPGGKLMMGGIVVANDISPIAHSDGDVVIHAIVDALLGAMGWGDIGERFPDSDPCWKDAPSRVFLEEVYGDVRRAGYHLMNLDVTILAERPKLKAHKPQMVETLTAILGGQVNIKAGTNEACDAIGRGEAIACHAVVLLGAGHAPPWP